MFARWIKTLFRTDPMKRAYRNCFATGQDLLVEVMMFQESYRAVGIELLPDESAFPQLDQILSSAGQNEWPLTLRGVSVFLGCIVTEQIGGQWWRSPEGEYMILDVGRSLATVDLSKEIMQPLHETPRPSCQVVFQRIRDSLTVS